MTDKKLTPTEIVDFWEPEYRMISNTVQRHGECGYCFSRERLERLRSLIRLAEQSTEDQP